MVKNINAAAPTGRFRNVLDIIPNVLHFVNTVGPIKHCQMWNFISNIN